MGAAIAQLGFTVTGGEFVALGQLESRPWHYPKFRWLFPVFFAMTTAGFITLILYRFFAGPPPP
jgi:hypothetical protein